MLRKPPRACTFLRREENWSEAFGSSVGTGNFGKVLWKVYHTLEGRLSGMAPSGLSHLDLILVCLTVWCVPRVSRRSTGYGQVVLYCFLTDLKVSTTRERNGKRQRKFMLLKSLCSYNHGLSASTDFCRSIHVFLICSRTRDGEGKNVMPWKSLCSVCVNVGGGKGKGGQDGSWEKSSEFKNNVSP